MVVLLDFCWLGAPKASFRTAKTVFKRSAVLFPERHRPLMRPPMATLIIKWGVSNVMEFYCFLGIRLTASRRRPCLTACGLPLNDGSRLWLAVKLVEGVWLVG